MFKKRRWAIVVALAALSLVIAAPATAQWAGTWVTSFQVMNLGTQQANVVVEYYRENGTRVDAATHSYSIQVGSSLNIYQPSVSGLPMALGVPLSLVQINPLQPLGASRLLTPMVALATASTLALMLMRPGRDSTFPT